MMICVQNQLREHGDGDAESSKHVRDSVRLQFGQFLPSSGLGVMHIQPVDLSTSFVHIHSSVCVHKLL